LFTIRNYKEISVSGRVADPIPTRFINAVEMEIVAEDLEKQDHSDPAQLILSRGVATVVINSVLVLVSTGDVTSYGYIQHWIGADSFDAAKVTDTESLLGNVTRVMAKIAESAIAARHRNMQTSADPAVPQFQSWWQSTQVDRVR
jgi:hypothetical protein